jgi:oxygen-independent coproporphyrinogen-3 oxidase
LPDADQAAQMQLACQQRLAAAHYDQYEISAYARAGRRCRHNLNYWQFGDYLGIGAGAHGKSSATQGAGLRIERSWREREPRRYLSSAGAAPARRVVPATDLPFEFLMNALRLLEGFQELDFEQRTGLSIQALAPGLARLRTRGLLERLGARWRASELGLSFLNDLLTEFLPEPPAARGALVGIS